MCSIWNSDGLEVAHEIRSRDASVGIVFVTSMAQYAIRGYEVNTIDFMEKPVKYYSFSVKLEKAVRFVKSRNQHDILLRKDQSVNEQVMIRRVDQQMKVNYYMIDDYNISNTREVSNRKLRHSMRNYLEMIIVAPSIILIYKTDIHHRNLILDNNTTAHYTEITSNDKQDFAEGRKEDVAGHL